MSTTRCAICGLAIIPLGDMWEHVFNGSIYCLGGRFAIPAERPGGDPMTTYRIVHWPCEYGRGNHVVGAFSTEAAAEAAIPERPDPQNWYVESNEEER